MARLKAPWREVPTAIARLDPALFPSADDVRAVLQVWEGWGARRSRLEVEPGSSVM